MACSAYSRCAPSAASTAGGDITGLPREDKLRVYPLRAPILWLAVADISAGGPESRVTEMTAQLSEQSQYAT